MSSQTACVYPDAKFLVFDRADDILICSIEIQGNLLRTLDSTKIWKFKSVQPVFVELLSYYQSKAKKNLLVYVGVS